MRLPSPRPRRTEIIATTSLAAAPGITAGTTLACATACGAMVASIYFSQPLIGLIAPELGLGAGISGLIVTLTQLGYGAGLLLLVPLADRFENRRLIVTMLIGTAVALVAVALSHGAASFFVATMVAGLCAAGAQMIVPFAASLAPEESRGRTIGNVMGGLLTGIMLARPAASLTASLLGWRAIFWIAAAVLLLFAIVLARVLPERRPSGERYGRILRSMANILRTTPQLRRRAAYQGLAFATFNIFWTTAPLMLGDDFGFGQRGIALFALAGAGGALAAPIAGRLGDRGHVKLGTGLALLAITVSALLSGVAVAFHLLIAVTLFAIVLDAGVQVNQVLGQRVIYSLPGEHRGRYNALYMTIVFVVGAGGSAMATLAYHAAGWWGAMGAAMALGVLVLALFATELRGAKA
jgi:predicted MFS family arabinose efflux permease